MTRPQGQYECVNCGGRGPCGAVRHHRSCHSADPIIVPANVDATPHPSVGGVQ